MHDEEFKDRVLDHLSGFPERNRDFLEMREVVFGNVRTGEKGIKQKVDEMHEILVQAKGWKSLALIVVLIGATVAVIKEWIMK